MAQPELVPTFDIVEMRQFVFSGAAAMHDVMIHRQEDGGISLLIEVTEDGQSKCRSVSVPLNAKYARLLGWALMDLAEDVR